MVTRPVWIRGQPSHLPRVVGEPAFPVIQVEGQFDSLTVAPGEEEVQGERVERQKKKKKSPRVLINQQGQCREERRAGGRNW